MKHLRLLLGSLCATAGLIVGCQKPSEGTAVTAKEPTTVTTKNSTTSTAAPAAPADVPGVKETLRDTIPQNAFVCSPSPTGTASATPATVTDPTAPRLTVTVPDGWTSASGTGDVALVLTGPDGMSGTVTITATTLEPVQAFDKYADDLAGKAALSSINLRPAEFCGYSSQELFGTLSGPPAETVDFADRITHIWTNTDNYMVVVHMQGPPDTTGFDDAKTALMQDFAIVIP